MRIISLNVTKEMSYIRSLCSSKSIVCFALNSTPAFELSHFECPGAVHARGCPWARASLEAYRWASYSASWGNPRGAFVAPGVTVAFETGP